MRAVCIAAAIALTLSSGAATIASGKYTVVSVQEGDLFTVKVDASDVEVRLYGADAPEKGQAFFNEARAHVESAIQGKEVALDAVTEDEDGHPVVVVRVPDGGVLHEAMVEQGLAWWDSVNVPENHTLKRLNATAIGGGAGLFKDATALTPWDYRKSQALKPVLYLKEAAAPAPAPAREEPKTLKAKGDGNASGDPAYMKSAKAAPGPTTAPAPALPGGGFVSLPPGIDTGDVDVTALMAKHQPRIATDSTGNPIGFTADAISQIPYASQLGFQDGDVVTSVNGQPVRSMFDALGLAESMKGVKSFNVTILRNGQPTTLNIDAP